MNYLILILTLFIPLLAKLLCEKFKFFKMLSPIITTYLLGFLFGNTLSTPEINEQVHKVIGVLLILSIPPLLYRVNIKAWLKSAPKMAQAFLLLIISLLATTFVSYWIFSDIDKIDQLLALSVATASGGLANTNAVAVIIGVSPEILSFMMVSIFIGGGIQLLLIMGPAPKLLARYFRKYQRTGQIIQSETKTKAQSKKQQALAVIKQLGLSILILAICIGVSFILFGKINGSFAILLSTTLGVAGSQVKKIRESAMSFEFGEYLVLMFCFQMAFITDFKQFITTDKKIILLVGLFYLIATVIHFFLCYLFKIDRDTTLIVNCAGIQGPPMIGIISQSLKNREIIFGGLLTAIIGIGVANYLGTLVFAIIKQL